MFVRWAKLVIKRPKTLLACSLVAMLASGAWGSTVLERLDGGGWEDPDAESSRAAAFLRTNLGRADADVVALYGSDTQTVDDAEFERAITDVVTALPEEHVVAVDSFYSTESAAFVSADRHKTFVVIQLAGRGDDERVAAFRAIEDALPAGALTLHVGGQVVTSLSVSEQADKDLARAELISLPLLLVLLLFVFRSVVAALLPLLIGVFAIAGSLAVLRVATMFTPVSAFAMNIVMLLGLGLAVDYALFMVSRFREELRHGQTSAGAIGRSICTAGRTVLFSALTVAGSMAGLLVFPQPFLRSMALGGMAAVVMALIGALVLLPAVLRVLGPRVNALPVGRQRAQRTGQSRAWGRLARSVMHQPAFYALLSIEILLLMGYPFLHVQFSRPDASVLPRSSEARIVSDTLDDEFGRNQTKPVTIGVTMNGDSTTPQNLARLQAYATRLSANAGVARIVSPATLPADSPVLPAYADGRFARMDVYFDAPAQSPQTQTLLQRIRDEKPPAESSVLVGGETAELFDLVNGRNNALLPMLGVILTVIGVLLFLAFGSLVLSIKAVIMNTLSLAASFGAVVWIFQDGHLAWLFGTEAAGSIDATQPVLMLAVVFGLSMDYEVFLLSRIKEAYGHTHNTAKAVAIGMQQTGPIITRAALLMIVVVGAFSTSDISLLKMIGVGMAVAIAVDATIVRALLVPALMRMMGPANWWTPHPLHALHDLFVPEPVPVALRERVRVVTPPHHHHPHPQAVARPRDRRRAAMRPHRNQTVAS
jgi:uncharacterized membrane protein YdfJ with MMPL/SSD domain